jgi:hypothetical protein
LIGRRRLDAGRGLRIKVGDQLEFV